MTKDAVIEEELEDIKRCLTSVHSRNVLAVVLVGSFARGEPTTLKNQNGKSLSDFDLILITRYYNPFFEKQLRIRLGRKKRNIQVSLGVIPLSYIKKHRTLYLYEAKTKGVVILGDSGILNMIAVNHPSEIPKWEAVRLLLNRIMELLETLSSNDSGVISFKDDIELANACAKGYLACCESILIMEGSYELNSHDRLERFKEIFDQDKYSRLRNIIPDLPKMIEACTRFKTGAEKENIGKPYTLLLNTRFALVETLAFILSQCFPTDTQDIFILLHRIENTTQPLKNGVLYFLRLFLEKRKISHGCFLRKSPALISSIVGIHLLLAIEENGKLDESFLQTLPIRLQRIFGLDFPPGKKASQYWEDLRVACILSWKISPQLVI